MKKRLRRKKYTGEFTTWYWRLVFDFKRGLSIADIQNFRQEFFAMLDRYELCYSGQSGLYRGLFDINGCRRYDSVVEAQRQLVTQWLQNHASVAGIVERPLERVRE